MTMPLDVDDLGRELSQLRRANADMLNNRKKVAPSETVTPGGAIPESTKASLQLRVKLAEKLAQLRELREKALVPPLPIPGPTPHPMPLPRGPDRPVIHPPPPRPNPLIEPVPTDEGKKDPPVDAVGLGRVLFLSGQHEKALETFRAIESAEQLPEDRLLTQYMMASCLRKMGKMEEAVALYREVANSGGSESLVTNSQWHLQNIKHRQELIAELARLRMQRKSLTRRSP